MPACVEGAGRPRDRLHCAVRRCGGTLGGEPLAISGSRSATVALMRPRSAQFPGLMLRLAAHRSWAVRVRRPWPEWHWPSDPGRLSGRVRCPPNRPSAPSGSRPPRRPVVQGGVRECDPAPASNTDPHVRSGSLLRAQALAMSWRIPGRPASRGRRPPDFVHVGVCAQLVQASHEGVAVGGGQQAAGGSGLPDQWSRSNQTGARLGRITECCGISAKRRLAELARHQR